MTDRRPPGDADSSEERLDPQAREVDALIRGLPRVEPSPRFKARFWARLARAEERAERAWSGRRLLTRLRPAGWLLAAGATAALALLLMRPGASVLEPQPRPDWDIVADSERFDLLTEADPELLATLDVLEAWDGAQGI